MQETTIPYHPKNHVRIVTAASLFDGHDAAINIMRRIIQGCGVEVIHLGHNRSVNEIVNCAIQEDVQGIAITSYQGGHVEFLKYMYDLLQEKKAGHIKLFAGGGGTILPDEIKELQDYGITRIFSPDDGRAMGLQGMVNALVEYSDFDLAMEKNRQAESLDRQNISDLARAITSVESGRNVSTIPTDKSGAVPVVGITGTGGAGKSSLVDELVRRFLTDFEDKYIAIISVDPSKRKSGGALLGDRIRMNSIDHPHVFMRSLATRQANLALSLHIKEVLDIVKSSGFDLIILETSGIGQSDTEVLDYADLSLYVMTPEYGAATQLEKIDMIDFADFIALNKFDKKGALDALRDIKKQYQRSRQLWHADLNALPVFGTIASQFNDAGTNALYGQIVHRINELSSGKFKRLGVENIGTSEKISVIPSDRIRYLAEVSETIRNYNRKGSEQAHIAEDLYALARSISITKEALKEKLQEQYEQKRKELDSGYWQLLEEWEATKEAYEKDVFTYKVRDKQIEINNRFETLSGLQMPVVSLPHFRSWGDILSWLLQENVPGSFPYTAGVFPFKRKGEDPTRMFAGEGGPERTNRRFHYLSQNASATRLSTAFDSVTLYGEDPDIRPDIYGKVGNSGVSISCLDDAKRLYSGFDLCEPTTSVSMTINGPAAIICAFFMNAAIDQQCEIYIRKHQLEEKVEAALKAKYDTLGLPRPQYQGALPEGHNGLGLLLLGITGDEILEAETYEKIKAQTLSMVRGTVQADILKEDQAQNTCIFSTEFSLRLMGDVQAYFITNAIRNFYSVSISGYHIAEAGANPITQLAFTLANGFTYVEYYLSRGMHIDDFAPNLSFFFSNGLDPEYAVIGRVARRIWAKAMKFKYRGNERSQKLKYHIQTSGRSLHAQEIDFNDIRTTLQALCAIYDNCNSLHTNAFDEAITTPTEGSVRRAMAIQLIINRELGLAKNENPLQGSFIIETLTDLVEEAVLSEFDSITERGGVLGAMESMYQRSQIQEESLYYESLKHSGKLPIVGVNTFLSSEGSPTIIPKEVIRATTKEKDNQIETVKNLISKYENEGAKQLFMLKEAALKHENLFEKLMDATKVCSLGQITHALFDVGGQYRRNM